MISEQDAVDDGEAADTEASLDARHATKMAKKKAARDRMMAAKHGEKGLIIVHTGTGKGKSSSAFGMILRCVAHGLPCAVVLPQSALENLLGVPAASVIRRCHPNQSIAVVIASTVKTSSATPTRSQP